MIDTYDPERGLWVSAYAGPPRSGKGTINEALSKLYPGSATDETGLDYRAVVWGMFNDGLIDPSMPPEKIQELVLKFSVEQLTDYAARRYEIIDENGLPAMYTPEINDTVPLLGETDVVRKAVKGGFVRRVKQKVNDPEIGVLFVDGRNLEELIVQAGGRIILSTFVVCSNDTAAERETARQKDQLARKGIAMTPDDEEEFRRKSFVSIAGRRKRDEERHIDPVQPSENSMQYWHNSHVFADTVEQHAKRYGMTLSQARRALSGVNLYKGGRVGVGAKAFRESRQVVFDTNPIDRTEMILRAHHTLEEAFGVAA